jgi:hypothetical protein
VSGATVRSDRTKVSLAATSRAAPHMRRASTHGSWVGDSAEAPPGPTPAPRREREPLVSSSTPSTATYMTTVRLQHSTRPARSVMDEFGRI